MQWHFKGAQSPSIGLFKHASVLCVTKEVSERMTESTPYAFLFSKGKTKVILRIDKIDMFGIIYENKNRYPSFVIDYSDEKNLKWINH